jgi:hypothetical protein
MLATSEQLVQHCNAKETYVAYKRLIGKHREKKALRGALDFDGRVILKVYRKSDVKI